MKQITVCASPLVHRIFVSRYGTEGPFKIHRSDVVYYYLQGDPIGIKKDKYKALNKLLTKKLVLQVSDALFEHLRYKMRNVYVGYYLHKIFQNEVLTFVAAQRLADVPAQRAFKNYFEYHGIDEDIYGLESAYATWKRRKHFLQKTKGNKGRAASVTVLNNNDLSETATVPVDPSDIIEIIEQYYNTPISSLNVYSRRVLAYFLKKESRLSTTKISNLLGCTARTIRKYITTVDFDLGIYDDLAGDIAKITPLLRAN